MKQVGAREDASQGCVEGQVKISTTTFKVNSEPFVEPRARVFYAESMGEELVCCFMAKSALPGSV